jgi:hypothetical protein
MSLLLYLFHDGLNRVLLIRMGSSFGVNAISGDGDGHEIFLEW